MDSEALESDATHREQSDSHLIVRFPWLQRFPRRVSRNAVVYRVTKRVFDLAFVLLTSPFWILVMGVIALLIKLEEPRGTVFYFQERTGKGGRRFKMYKFRTMVMGADKMKADLAHLNELQWPDFKIANDPRITRVGRFLRKSSLDELPQVLNVLKGEMSLVGPRPTSFSVETYSLWQTERLDVFPGVTGLWQLLGRGSTEFDERLRMDIAYIERRSFWLDMVILARTVRAVLQRRGAY
jgi:lipopolysaccharide/colanic/teichoic acid biosynthesis glycosyltransferase